MGEEKTDRRVRRTYESLQKALIDLMVERGYEVVTVQHILDRAGVGRSTFYTHFRDKEDLLRSSIDNLREGLVRHWKAMLAAEGKPMGELGFALPFFRHVDSHRHVHRAVIGRESGIIVDRHFRRILGEMVRTDFAGRLQGLALEATVQVVVGALMSLTSWWLDHKVRLSPEEINAIFLQLTLQGASGAGFRGG